MFNLKLVSHWNVTILRLVGEKGLRHKRDFLPFLAHLSRRLIGELIVYKGIRRPSVRSSTFSNDISSEAEKPILFMFHI